MDEHNHRRRQNDPPYVPPDPRFMSSQGQGRGFSSSTSQRYRSSALQSSLAGRGDAGATTYSGYYQEPTASFATAMPPSAVPYQSSYAQEPRQQQTFTGYNTDMMYNVTPQAPQSGVYDSSQQFQATRQPAAMQMLPDEGPPYFQAEQGSASGQSAMQHQAAPSSANVYQQHQQSPADRSSMLQQSYPATIAMGGMGQAAPEMMETEGFQSASASAQTQTQPQPPPMEVAYNSYLTALKEIFLNIVHVRLSEASRSLLEVSEWLLGHVTDLGRQTIHICTISLTWSPRTHCRRSQSTRRPHKTMDRVQRSMAWYIPETDRHSSFKAFNAITASTDLNVEGLHQQDGQGLNPNVRCCGEAWAR